MGFYNRVGPLNTGKSCGVSFKIRDGEKKIIKRGWGREGKLLFFNHTSSLLVWLEINRMVR